MDKKRSKIKVLYLQIRDDVRTCKEELDEFVRYSELLREQFTVLNVFNTPQFSPRLVDEYDTLFVGGSSDASVIYPKKYTFVKYAQELMLYCLDEAVPVFASCFGFQTLVTALEGTVILDKKNMEMGVYKIYLTEEAKKDLLFCDTPEVFWAVSGHKERAISLPEGAIMLAYSELCPYHAIKMEGKPFYAFQFHPEVNTDDLVMRITRYKERYLDGDEELNKILDKANKKTPDSNLLIKKFVDRVLL